MLDTAVDPMLATGEAPAPGPFPEAGPLFVLDGTGLVHDFNLTAENTFSLEPADRGRPLLDLIASPTARDRLERDFHYALNLCSSSDAVGQSLPLLTRSGAESQTKRAVLRLARERREGENASHFLASLHSEAATPVSAVLRPLQSLLDTLVANTREGVVIHELASAEDTTERVLYANDIAADYLGFDSLAHLMATPATQIWHAWKVSGETGPVNLADIPHWLAEQGGLSLEATLSFRPAVPGTAQRWLTVNTSVAFGAGHEDSVSTGIAVFLLHDVTKARRTDHELVRALQKQERAASEIAGVLGQIADGVVITDAEGKLTFLNHAARLLFGLQPDSAPENISDLGENFTVEGQPMAAVEHPLHRAALAGETVQDQEWRLCRADSSGLWVQGSAAPLRDPSGASTGAVLTLRDVSQRHAMLHELERANQMKDDFLTILSHELRTPLTPLVGWISLLRSQAKAGKTMSPQLLGQALEALEINIEQQKKIIEELLDASHLVLGRAKFQKTAYPLTALVREAVTNHQKSMTAKEISVEMDLDPQIPPLPVDTARMGQAISHLIGNAVEFSPPGGRIWIKSQRMGLWARLEIRDEGAGISPDFLPHIFDMFRQGDTPFTRRHGGLGMGLTLVKAIIEAHDGEITAASEGAGKGAQLTIRLPLS